ncbi:MAG: recombinase family protein [Gordonia sp. (in: high G+C Gram-positive bacteria)]
MRSYGWSTSGEVIADEAKVISEVAARLDDGEPLRAAARWLNDTGVTTVQGKQWAALTVRRMVTSPRVVGDVDGYPAILDRDLWERLREHLLDPDRAKFAPKGAQGAPSWISGLVHCGRCGGVLYAQSDIDLKCSGAPPQGGTPCRVTSIRREYVENDVEARILARLSDKRSRARLLRAAADPARIRHDIDDAEHRSVVLATEYGAGTLSQEAFTAGARAVRGKIDELGAQLARADLGADLPEIRDVADWWSRLSSPRRRDVLQVLLDDVVVAPKEAKVADRLEYHWR